MAGGTRGTRRRKCIHRNTKRVKGRRKTSFLKSWGGRPRRRPRRGEERGDEGKGFGAMGGFGVAL